MIASITTWVNSWLGHKPTPVPFSLELRMTRLRASVRQGGRGCDLAAAELKGITQTIMELCR